MNHDTGYGRRNGGNGAGKGTGNSGGYGAYLLKRMATALLTLAIGLCMAAPTVRAETLPTAEQGQRAISQTPGTRRGMLGTELLTRGNLVYRQKETGAQVYAADFLLLQDWLSTIPDTVFEPACYTHTHRWEYLDINGETHTRHCEICGSAYDLVGAHKAKEMENCTFSYDGAEYAGTGYTCDCGYRWEREEAHTLVFDAVDENTHRSRCRLDGSDFCTGYEPAIEEHYAYHYKPCGDGKHHERICMDCGYQDQEECRFSAPDTDGDGGNDDESKRCWCGNVEKPDAETKEDVSGTEPEDEKADAETEEDSSGTEPEDEKADVEMQEDSSGTGNEGEKADAETEEDVSGTESEDEKADAETEEDSSGTGSEGEKADAETEEDSSGTEPEGEKADAETEEDSFGTETADEKENTGIGEDTPGTAAGE